MTAAQFEQIHVEDYGTILRMTIGEYDDDGNFTAVDISSATTKTFRFRKPDGETFEEDAEFTAGGTDGRIEFTVPDEDWFDDQDGGWQIQARLIMPTGGWWSEIKSFQVYANIEAPPTP